MFEHEEIMAIIADLEEQLKVSEMAPPSAEQLIACLEGEIAERDARIVELESDLAGTQSRVLSLQDQWRKLDAELAAIKAQEPAARQFQVRDGSWHPFISEQHYQNTLADGWPIRALYAAPVSEAKAQGVVLTDEELCSIRNQVACNEVRRDDDSRTICVKHGRALEAAVLARLNAAPVQLVSVPDVSAMARILADRNADACNVNREDNWAIYGQDYIDDVTAMLAAAPAAPAADAGIVDMYRHLQKVTPYRFKKIQDASITDGGDVMYFHKDRFDAALLADMAAHCAANGVV